MAQQWRQTTSSRCRFRAQLRRYAERLHRSRQTSDSVVARFVSHYRTALFAHPVACARYALPEWRCLTQPISKVQRHTFRVFHHDRVGPVHEGRGVEE